MIRKTVSEILSIPEKTITLPKISSSRRVLLSGIYVSYDINITSYRTPESYKLALTEAMVSGAFVSLIEAKSTVGIQSMYDLHFDDYSPTSQPSISPLSLLSGSKGMVFVTIDRIVPKYWSISILNNILLHWNE